MIDKIEVKIEGGLAIPLPRMVPVRQHFDPTRIQDIPAAVAAELEKEGIGSAIGKGMEIAIGVGSRGVANIGETVKVLVDRVKARGGRPFVFPAMGSHGGGTAEGQAQVLARYGISEESCGAPVRSSMEVMELGRMPDGTPVFVDKHAHGADGLILVNRIKPHTNFRGDIESGVIKMMVIGMGKHAGATAWHAHGMDMFPNLLPAVAEFIMQRMPFLFGLGMVENAYDQTALLEAIPAALLIEREKALLERAKALLGRLPFEDIDVLVIDRMGKDISGAGFDPNITGRNNRGVEWDQSPRIKKIVVLDLTEKTHGNVTGLGVADAITRKLFDKIDFGVTYANVITSTLLDGGCIPMIMNTEQEAIQLAVKTVVRVQPEQVRIIRIADTLSLGEILISEPMLAEAKAHERLEIIGEPAPFSFDGRGNLQAA